MSVSASTSQSDTYGYQRRVSTAIKKKKQRTSTTRGTRWRLLRPTSLTFDSSWSVMDDVRHGII